MYQNLKGFAICFSLGSEDAWRIRIVTIQNLMIWSSRLRSLFSGNYTQALEDFKECLELQLKHLEPDSRLLAETYYQLGLTYNLDCQYNQAIEELNSSISVIKSRLGKLKVELAFIPRFCNLNILLSSRETPRACRQGWRPGGFARWAQGDGGAKDSSARNSGEGRGCYRKSESSQCRHRGCNGCPGECGLRISGVSKYL